MHVNDKLHFLVVLFYLESSWSILIEVNLNQTVHIFLRFLRSKNAQTAKYATLVDSNLELCISLRCIMTRTSTSDDAMSNWIEHL